MLNKNYSAPEKLAILDEIAIREIGIKAAAKKYGITKTTLSKWRRRCKIIVIGGDTHSYSKF